jgi:hypothetical protein
MLHERKISEPQVEEELGHCHFDLEKLVVVIGSFVGEVEQLALVPGVRVSLQTRQNL